MAKRYCNCCMEAREIEDFNWKNREKGIHQSSCRFCIAEKNRKHYIDNKQVYISKAKRRNIRIYDENRKLLCEYLSTHPCVDCGCDDVRVLEFDHVRGLKTDEVTRILSTRASWSTIEAEIAKCEVRCANCHRLKTYERGCHWRFTAMGDSSLVLDQDK
jgi:hypothetical protein